MDLEIKDLRKRYETTIVNDLLLVLLDLLLATIIPLIDQEREVVVTD